jgi:hypothetical protein
MGISMDSLQLLVSWNKSQTSVDISTATLSGIYIQGARMTSAVGMEECFVETPSWNPIPPCFLSWVPLKDAVRKTDATTYSMHWRLTPHFVNFIFIKEFSGQWIAHC